MECHKECRVPDEHLCRDAVSHPKVGHDFREAVIADERLFSPPRVDYPDWLIGVS